MKTILISLSLICFTFLLNAQKISEFFHPTHIKSKVSFQKADGIKLVKEYYYENSLLKVITRATKEETEYMTLIDKYSITEDKAVITERAIITFGEPRSIIEYTSKDPRLMLPKKDQKAEWTFNDDGTVYKCVGKLIELDINGEKKQTIQVKYTATASDEEWEGFEYYVKGIGFYKEEHIEGDDIIVWREMTEIK